MDVKKRRRSRENNRSRSRDKRRSRERGSYKDQRYRGRTRKDSYSNSRSRSRDRRDKKTDRYRDYSRSSSYSDRGRYKNKDKKPTYDKHPKKFDADRKRDDRKERRPPSYSKSRSPSSEGDHVSYKDERRQEFPNSKVDRLVSKLTGKFVPEEDNDQNGQSSNSSKRNSQLESESPDRPTQVKVLRNEGQSKDYTKTLATKPINSSQTQNHPQTTKSAVLRIEKVERSAPNLAAKQDSDAQGTGLFSKPAQKFQLKPKIILSRPETTDFPPIKKVPSGSGHAKRSTGAFEIYEYPVSNPKPDSRERQEGSSLLERITKKDNRAGNSGSVDIRSRIIKNPLKY